MDKTSHNDYTQTTSHSQNSHATATIHPIGKIVCLGTMRAMYSLPGKLQS